MSWLGKDSTEKTRDERDADREDLAEKIIRAYQSPRMMEGVGFTRTGREEREGIPQDPIPWLPDPQTFARGMEGRHWMSPSDLESHSVDRDIDFPVMILSLERASDALGVGERELRMDFWEDLASGEESAGNLFFRIHSCVLGEFEEETVDVLTCVQDSTTGGVSCGVTRERERVTGEVDDCHDQ